VFAAGPSAGPAAERPVTAREVYRCDFETTDDIDYDLWPDGWRRLRGPGLPEFVKIGIVRENGGQAGSTDAIQTNHALRIDLDGSGGHVASPTIAISPQFSYVFTTRVKTSGLARNAAGMTLTLLNAAGQVLETHESPLVRGDTPWQTLQIGPITPLSGEATHALLYLHLLPQGRYGDLVGSVLFDEVRLSRSPRITLTANQRTHLFTQADTAEVRCEVSGIANLDPVVTFELFDHLGRQLASHQQQLSGTMTDAGGGTFAGSAAWRPPLPDYGFYLVRAAMHGKENVVLDRTISLALLRPISAPPRGEFGWSLESDQSPLPSGPLASLLGQVGVHWAKLPVWFDASQPQRAEQIAAFAEQVSLQGVELVGVLDQPPAELRQLFREQGRLPVASVFIEPELWQPALSPVLTRLSLKIRWWQLGADDDTSFVSYPQLERKIAEIKRALEQFGQEIHLGLNWRLPAEPPRAAQPPWSYLSYSSEPDLTAEELAAYLPDFKRTGSERWLVLNPLPRGEYSTETRARDLVMRMISAKLSGATAAFVPQPFDADRGIVNPDGTPGELLLPWRTTSRLISGADYLGQVQLAGGSTGHIFARGGKAVMVVWSDEPTKEWIFFGDDIEQLDLWGRSTRPPLALHEGHSQHEIQVGHSPTFITGLSEAVARWQIALSFESQRLASIFGREQMIVLQLQNTFPQGIGGEVTLHAPKSWSYDSRPLRFKLTEGDAMRMRLPITLLTDANSGPQPLRLDFAITADRDYKFSVHRTLQLGLEDVQLRLTTRLRDDGALLVEQQITNLSDFPISFQCILFPPGRRRETRQVIDLSRGRNTLTFVLPNGQELLGQKLWLRAEEIRGPRVLNYTITAER
jgi:hypothetical protein